MTEEHSCCRTEHEPPKPWYKRGIFWVAAILFVLLAASFAWSPFSAFRHSLHHYLEKIYWPLFLGFVIGGLIDYYIPREYVSKVLASHQKRTVFYAAGLGFLMSACSHGILALSMELHKKGASGPAVMSFLLASPWANLPITFLLIGFFGMTKAFIIIFGALAIAMTTGLLFQLLDRRGMIEKNRHTLEVPPGFSVRKDIGQRFARYSWTAQSLKKDLKGILRGMAGLFEMVAAWLVFGMILAALAEAFVPAETFQRYLGPSVGGLLITLGLATVLEVCSEGTAPLAFSIYNQTRAFGNAFAFLMGGVVTDYTEIGLIWAHIGRRTAMWMLILTLPQVVIAGLILNALF